MNEWLNEFSGIMSCIRKSRGSPPPPPPSSPPSWFSETGVQTPSSPAPEGSGPRGHSMGRGRTGGWAAGIAQEADQSPPVPQPLACPCHTHVTRVLLKARPGHIPREGPGGGGRGRARSGTVREYCSRAPGLCRPKLTLKGSVRRSQKKREATWRQGPSPRLERRAWALSQPRLTHGVAVVSHGPSVLLCEVGTVLTARLVLMPKG